MRQITPTSDSRHDHQCSYCGGSGRGSRDHVPSKVLLLKPFPENLPVVPSCIKCNNKFSLDEEYLACLLACVISGSANPKKITLNQYSKRLIKNASLQKKLNKAKNIDNGNISFEIEANRVKSVLIKLAKGHWRYENSTPMESEPNHVLFMPLLEMDNKEKDDFFDHKEQFIFPEIGSRAFYKALENNRFQPTWQIVQPNIYQYSTLFIGSSFVVRILIWDYLACEVIWEY